MSTGSMPNPPDQPTTQVLQGDPLTQNAAVHDMPDTRAQAQPQAESPFNLAGSVADIIESNADTIAQRLNYHSQLLYGVSAIGIDVVNGRNAALVLANALRSHANPVAEHSLVHVGTPQLAQVNDATLPYKNNAQIAGIFEGLVLDTVSRAYADDPGRIREATVLLNGIFQSANEEMQHQSRAMVNFQAPIGDPNARS